MTVPRHADREGVTAIVGEVTMAIVFKEYCIVTDPPLSFNVTEAGIKEYSANEAEQFGDFDIEKDYFFDEDAGEVISEEISELPESIKMACESKPLRRTKRVGISETTFNQRNIIQYRFTRQRQGQNGQNCSTLQVSLSRLELYLLYILKYHLDFYV